MRWTSEVKLPENKKYLTLLMILLAGGITVIAGCSRRNDPIVIPLTASAKETETVVREEKLADTVDIYLDTTPSMVGYLGLKENQEAWATRAVKEAYGALVPKTNYVVTGLNIDDLIAVHWAGANRNFYRFDVALGKLKNRKDLMDSFMFYNFYSKSYYADKLQLGQTDQNEQESVVEIEKWFGNNTREAYRYTEDYLSETIAELDPEHLSVLVTDLYELGDDTGSLYEAIANAIIQSDNVVSLIGIQSQFAGTIYDLNDRQDKVVYGVNNFAVNPTAEEIRFHPFYVLVFGDEYNVNEFTENLTERLKKSFEEDQVQNMLFNYEKQVTGFDDYSFTSDMLDSQGGILYDTTIRFIAEEGKLLPSGFQAYKISRKNYNDTSELTQVFQIQNENLKTFLLGKTAEQIETSMVDVSCMETASGTFENAQVRNGTLEVTSVDWNNTGEFTVKIKLHNVNELEKRLYRFRICLTCSPEERTIEPWIFEWDLDKSRMNEWLENPDSFPGRKTNNLKETVQLLMKKTEPNYAVHEIAYLDCYFNIVD